MNRDIHQSWCAAGALVLSLFVPTLAEAQSPWLNSEPGTVSLEALRPSIEGSEFTALTMAYFLSGRVELANGMQVVAELPFSHAGSDPGAGVESQSASAIGNPYVGMEMGLAALPVISKVEFGVRLPLSTAFGDEAFEGTSRAVGLIASSDRGEAFASDVAALSAMASTEFNALALVKVRVRAGGVFDYLTDAAEGQDASELFAAYDAQAWSWISTARVGAGVNGRTLVTESDLNFGERSWHDLGVWADYGIGAFRPGAHIRVPLDDDGVADYIFGLSVQYAFGR